MKKHQHPIFLLCFLFASFNSFGQAYEENFDSGLPSDWTDYTEAGFDFVNWFGGEVSMFKQSDGAEIIMLAAPALDLSQYTRMEIDYYGFNLAFGSETVPDLHIGILEQAGDFNSFKSIYELSVTNTTTQVFSIDIGAYSGMANLCFKLLGERSQIIYIDNFKLYDDNFESNIPVAVQNIAIEPSLNSSNDLTISWDNPALEADGDPLTELSSILLRNEGVDVQELENINIGERQDFLATVPAAGFYKFEIIPKNSFGEGHKVFAQNIWIGLDQPGAARNITVEQNGEQVRLNWEVPNTGANNSFFDGIVDAYTIKRSDGKEFLVPGDEAEFIDILDTEGSIRYEIIGENSSGFGTSSFTEALFYTTEAHVYYEDFNFNIVKEPGATLDYDYAWTNQSTVSNSYWTWFSSNFIGENAGELSWIWTSTGSPSDMVRAVSPRINTSGYSALSLAYNFYFEAAGTSTYTVVIQTSSDGGNSWNDVEAIEINAFSQGSYSKTIANADVGSDQFQFAFTRIGPTNQNPFMRIDNVRLRNQPGIDVRAVSLDIPKTVEPGTELNIIASVENNSSEITSGSVTCEIKTRFGTQTTEQTYAMSYDDMSIGDIVTETFGPWTAVEGEYTVELCIDNVQDAIQENNCVTKVLNVFKLRDRQKVIIEEFSGTWCAYCPGAALAVEDLYKEGYNVAAITYHRSDAYETDIVQERMDLYSILGFPTSMFDGEIKSEGGDLNVSIIDDYRPIVENLRVVKSPVQIEFNSAVLSNTNPGEDKSYSVSVNVNSESVIQNPNLSLVAAITESGIEEEWQSLDVLDYVQRDFSSSPIDLSGGNTNVIFNFVLDGNQDIEHSEFIVFLQDTDDNQIFNGNSLPVSMQIEPSSTQNLDVVEMEVYPNPSSQNLNLILDEKQIGKKQFSIVDVSGKIVLEGIIDSFLSTLDLSNLENGMYHLEVRSEKFISRSKFIKMQ